MPNGDHRHFAAGALPEALLTTPTTSLQVNERFLEVKLPSRSSTFQCYVREVVNLESTGDLDLFFIHGMAHNNLVYSRLFDLIVSSEPRVRRLYALDLPGHGRSGYPEGMKFGDLSLEDYLATVLQVLEAVAPVRVLVGHSLGGILIMMLEELLRDRERSLRDYGIEAVALIAPTLPEEVPWRLAEGKVLPQGLVSDLLLQLTPYVSHSAEMGIYAAISDEEHLKLFYTNSDDEVVNGAPAGELLSTLNDIEAYQAASEMGGVDVKWGDMFRRPHVSEGLFSSYLLGLASFSEDLYLLPSELEALCAYLSSSPDRLYLPVAGPEAVHCTLFSAPDRVIPLFQFLFDRL